LGSIDHTNCPVSSKLPAFPAGRLLGLPAVTPAEEAAAQRRREEAMNR